MYKSKIEYTMNAIFYSKASTNSYSYTIDGVDVVVGWRRAVNPHGDFLLR